MSIPGLQIRGNIPGVVSELFTAMDAKYIESLASRPTPWARTISGWTSTAALRVKYPVDLTALDGFREWVNERSIKDGDLGAFYVDSKPFERSIKIDLDVAMSGQAPAVYVNKVPGIVRAAAVHPNRLIAAALKAGQTNKVQAFDGIASTGDNVPLFGNHRVNIREGSTTFSNLYTSKPFTAPNFALAKKHFRSLKAPDGNSLGLVLTHLLAPTDLEEQMNQLFDVNVSVVQNVAKTENVAAAAGNLYFGAVPPERRIIAPELDSEPSVWYGLALNQDARPFESQFKDDGAPEIQVMGPGTDYAVMTNQLLWAAKLFGNVGAAFPHVIVRFEP